MDRFQAMQAFIRIVELGAFGKAADSLELPRASVTQAIQQLEAHLGVQLLQRTTRQVSLTLDGQAYYERCVRLLADLEEAESCFPRVLNNPRGRLRVDLPGALGRMRVIPFLPEFCERYPELELQLSSNDRLVDLLREGADCVLRVGELHDSSLVGRHLADLPQVTCASAAYLERHGHPRQLAELGGHLAVIDDEDELQEIIRLAEEAGISRVWVGCHRVNGEMTWEYGRGGILPWAAGEPTYVDQNDQVAEDYIMLWNHSGWAYNDNRDDPCADYPDFYSGTMGYICEFETA